MRPTSAFPKLRISSTNVVHADLYLFVTLELCTDPRMIPATNENMQFFSKYREFRKDAFEVAAFIHSIDHDESLLIYFRELQYKVR